MLTLLFSAFFASILTCMPGAASSHFGLSEVSNGGTNGCVPASAAMRLASRQTISQSGSASRFPAGNPHTTRFELQPKPSRAEKAPAAQTETRDPDVLDCACRVLSSSRRLHFSSQAFSKFFQSGPDPRLHGSKRLV